MTFSEKPYSQFDKEKLILRDYLAAHRTVLANDRTALAYIRTMLTFLIGGATFIRFFHTTFLTVIGWIFIPIGLVIGGYGVYYYLRVRSLLSEIPTDEAPSDEGSEGGGPDGD